MSNRRRVGKSPALIWDAPGADEDQRREQEWVTAAFGGWGAIDGPLGVGGPVYQLVTLLCPRCAEIVGGVKLYDGGAALLTWASLQRVGELGHGDQAASVWFANQLLTDDHGPFRAQCTRDGALVATASDLLKRLDRTADQAVAERRPARFRMRACSST